MISQNEPIAKLALARNRHGRAKQQVEAGPSTKAPTSIGQMTSIQGSTQVLDFEVHSHLSSNVKEAMVASHQPNPTKAASKLVPKLPGSSHVEAFFDGLMASHASVVRKARR